MKKRHLLLSLFTLVVCTISANDLFEEIKGRIFIRNICNIEFPIDSLVEEAIDGMNDEGSYPDIDYSSYFNVQWDAIRHLSRIKDMVCAYTYPEENNAYYGDNDILSKIVKGLQYWYDLNPNCDNWWKNTIDEPQQIGILLIAMDRGVKNIPDNLRSSLILRMEEEGGDPETYTGANRTDIAMHRLYRACLVKDKALLEQSLFFLYEPIVYTYDEGLQIDGSYFQHGQQLYMGGYADRFLTSILDVCEYTYGTDYELSKDKMEILRRFFKDNYLKNIRGQVMNFNSVGRDISRQSRLKRPELWGYFCQQMQKLDEDSEEEYILAKQRIEGKLNASEGVMSSHTHYYRADYTLHTRPEYSFSVKMSSNRTNRTESLNDENILGYYLSDGSSCIMRTGDEYYDVMPLWDWNLIPGTTAPAGDIPTFKGNMKGFSDFAGGVSDSVYGVSVYSYYDERKDIKTGAKKSWFFFDDEVVCLGAGLRSDYPYHTTIDQNWGGADFRFTQIWKNYRFFI